MCLIPYVDVLQVYNLADVICQNDGYEKLDFNNFLVLCGKSLRKIGPNERKYYHGMWKFFSTEIETDKSMVAMMALCGMDRMRNLNPMVTSLRIRSSDVFKLIKMFNNRNLVFSDRNVEPAVLRKVRTRANVGHPVGIINNTGLTDERNAIEVLRLYGYNAVKCGPAINKTYNYVVAASDGVIYVNEKPVMLIEVKSVGDREAMSKHSFYNTRRRKLEIKKPSAVYTQIQISMALYKIPYCMLVLTGRNDGSFEKICITENKAFIKTTLQTLKYIYFHYALPIIYRNL